MKSFHRKILDRYLNEMSEVSEPKQNDTIEMELLVPVQEYQTYQSKIVNAVLQMLTYKDNPQALQILIYCYSKAGKGHMDTIMECATKLQLGIPILVTEDPEPEDT